MESKVNEDLNQKVYQTVIYGSLYEAFYNKFVNIQEVLEFLLHYQVKNKTEREKVCIAYRIVCIFTKEQTINGKHFICQTCNEDFISIYALSFNSHFQDKTYLSFDENVEISRKIQNILPKLIQEDEYSRFFYVLCDIVNKIKPEEGIIIAFTRNVGNLINFESDYAYFLHADYLHALDNIPVNLYVHDLIDRCSHLKKDAPLYWENVAFSIYSSFVKDKFTNAPNFTKDMIHKYHEIFPNLFSEKILNRSDIVLRISNLNTNFQAYLLGFPIHEYIPGEANLNKALDDLQEMGVEKYCNFIAEKNKRDDVANETNVLSEEIIQHNPFDIVEYYVDEGNLEKHLFRFTRSEFSNILKDGKNFYTGKVLPLFVIERIKCRQNIAKQYTLPKCKTLRDFLTDLDANVESDTEYVSEYDELESDENEPEVYVLGRARSQETGEETNFRFPVMGELDDLDTEDLDEIIQEVLNYRGLDYLGRICPSCEISRYDEDSDIEEINP